MAIRVALIEKFLRECAPHLRTLASRRDTSIGFNAFAMVSDTYRRENFHSDIIRTILDPDSGHGEGTLFLRKFVGFLAERAKVQGHDQIAKRLGELDYGGKIEVLREEGRIDVKIKAPTWTIIIENKINGAGDMDRQIPRYLEKCADNNENVVAAVYLKASEEDSPSRNGWIKGDEELVGNQLIPIVGYSETKSILNMVEGWLEPCELLARDFNAKSILLQYGELIRNQAGETMNNDELKKVLSAMSANNVPYSEMRNVIESIPNAVASMIAEKFNGYSDDLMKTRVWSKTVAVLDFLRVDAGNEGVYFAVDVHCEDLGGMGVSFFSRTDGVDLSSYIDLLKECDPRFGLDTDAWGDTRIAYVCDPDKCFSDVDGFADEIKKIVDFFVNNKGRFEAIAKGE